MKNTPKVVVSDSLTESPWDGVRVVGGDLTEAVRRLEAEPGGDVITYGGSTLVRGLIAGGLVDEIRLVSARPFACGVTALHLEPRR